MDQVNLKFAEANACRETSEGKPRDRINNKTYTS